MLKIEQNPYNENEFSVIESNESYHETYLSDLSSYNNGDEIDLINWCEGIGVNVEYYSFRQDDYCTKQEYLDHFIDYDSDKEYIVARATLTKEQAKRLYNKLI